MSFSKRQKYGRYLRQQQQGLLRHYERPGYGENIQRFSVTGNEKVIDAVAQIHGLTRTGGAKIWIER